MSLHRLVIALASAAAIACASRPAHGAADARPAIDGVDVEQVAAIAAGVPLRFSVYGTPGATVALRIEGARRVLALRESMPGVYEGTYVIGAEDAVSPASRVAATLEQDGALVRAELDEPLLLAEAPLPWADAARAAPPVPSAAQPVPPAAPLVPRAAPETVAARPADVVALPAPAPSAAGRATCDDCALVESVRTVETPPGPLGAIAGAIAGAVLGDELGREHTRRMTRVLGAIGGAVAGREFERRLTQVRYDVVLRMPDGAREVRRYERVPPFAAGAIVRLGAVRSESARSP